MSEELDFDTAEACGFDGTGRAGDARFPHTVLDAIQSLNDRVSTLVERGHLVVHDGSLPYMIEVVATIDNAGLGRVLTRRFPSIVQDWTDGVAFGEEWLNVDCETGQIDPELPLTDRHLDLADLVTLLEAIVGD